MHTVLSLTLSSLHSAPFSHQNIPPAFPSTSQEFTPLITLAQLQVPGMSRLGTAATLKKTSLYSESLWLPAFIGTLNWVLTQKSSSIQRRGCRESGSRSCWDRNAKTRKLPPSLSPCADISRVWFNSIQRRLETQNLLAKLLFHSLLTYSYHWHPLKPTTLAAARAKSLLNILMLKV